TPGAQGAAWLPPVFVNGAGFGPPSLAVDDKGDVFAAWVAPGDELALTKRPVGGAFETPQIIHVNTFEPQIGVDGAGNAVVVWTSTAGGGSLQQSRRGVNDSAFSLPTAVDTDPGIV